MRGKTMSNRTSARQKAPHGDLQTNAVASKRKSPRFSSLNRPSSAYREYDNSDTDASSDDDSDESEADEDSDMEDLEASSAGEDDDSSVQEMEDSEDDVRHGKGRSGAGASRPVRGASSTPEARKPRTAAAAKAQASAAGAESGATRPGRAGGIRKALQFAATTNSKPSQSPASSGGRAEPSKSSPSRPKLRRLGKGQDSDDDGEDQEDDVVVADSDEDELVQAGAGASSSAVRGRVGSKAAAPVQASPAKARAGASSSQPVEDAGPTPGQLELEWLGQPTKVDAASRGQASRTHYAAFRLRGVVLCLGDWVEVLTEKTDSSGKSNEKFYVAKLLDAWQTEGQGAAGAVVTVSWALPPDEVASPPPSTGPREVFPTTWTDSVALATINSRVRLVTPQQWETRRKAKAAERLTKVKPSPGAASAAGKRGRPADSDLSDSDDSDASAETEVRVQALAADEDRVAAVYCARYGYDRQTKHFLPYAVEDGRAAARATMQAVGVADSAAGAATSSKAGKKGKGKGTKRPVLATVAHVPSLPLPAMGLASGSGVHMGGGQDGAAGAPLDPSDPDALFKATVAQLHLSAVPASLPCREAERGQLSGLLTSAITQAANGGGGQALYISGMPGTGKTATVTEVVRSLSSSSTSGALAPFTYVEINAMKLASPYALYSSLWRAMTGQVLSPAKACQMLEARFASRGSNASGQGAGAGSSSGASDEAKKKRRRAGNALPSVSVSGSGLSRTVLLVVDELDYCVTKKQSVLYNLFEWPTTPGSGLVVLGIANTMDMPERLLPRVASRLGMGRVVFTPYTPAQIETIVAARLAALPSGVFDPTAITLASKKVASVSGDVRRALALCRRAAEQAWLRLAKATTGAGASAGAGSSKPSFHVALEDVKRASQDLGGDLVQARMAGATSHERLLLLALASHVRINGGDGALLDVLHARVQGMVRKYVDEAEYGHPQGKHLGLPQEAWEDPDTLWAAMDGAMDPKGKSTVAKGSGAASQNDAAAVAAEKTYLRLQYLPCPSAGLLTQAAQRLADSQVLHVEWPTKVGAYAAMQSGSLTGQPRGGQALAGAYPAVRLAVGVEDVAQALRGEPLTELLKKAGAL